MPKKLKIVVAGDITVDWLQWTMKPRTETKNGPSLLNWQLYLGTRMVARPGGALMLAGMVQEATKAQVLAPELTSLENIPPEKNLHSNVLLGQFPCSRDPRDKKNLIYRVERDLGFAGPDEGPVSPHRLELDDPAADLVVLDDAGNGFRDVAEAWPQAVKEDGRQPLVVLKMSRPLMQGKLWDRVRQAHGERLLVVINANYLRSMGINISRQLSWERTACDFLWQMVSNRELAPLAACGHVVVRFGLDGAIHYQQKEKGPEVRLYYDPLHLEGSFNEKYPGTMFGLTNAFVAGLITSLAETGLEGIGEGVRRGILSSRELLLQGFGRDPKTQDYPPDIFTISDQEKALIKDIRIPLPPTLDCADPSFWNILGDLAQARLEEMAINIVETGIDRDIDRVPVGEFGRLKTLDRVEIESLRSIKNLISEYLHQGHQKKPLSLAVFGPPGSGKSFAVTEVATQVAESIAGYEIVPLEFNLSQCDSPQDLIKALHQVRDLVLQGKMPLVFFDEFDSELRGLPLGWLKYFLEPMQSGAFREGEAKHTIGKAIFVFAGGTSKTLQEFSREGREEKEVKEFGNAKGPDFVSRLRGYVNILGINPSSESDKLYLIRRAVVLRTLLKIKLPNLFDEQGRLYIDRGVLSALLRTPLYKHGVRSMEAVLDMSILGDRRLFEPAALPPLDQLQLHVNAEYFCRLLVQDVLFGGARERLAQIIHEAFVEDNRGEKPPDDPGMQPWETLREDFKESNRRQADQIPEKLRTANCWFRPTVGREPVQFEFTEPEINELAKMEHDRFVAERLAAGWKYGPKRDDQKKENPTLIDWDNLPESEKAKDLAIVRRIPEFLTKLGFEIYRQG